MKIEGLRSPTELVGGIVHFGRMLDKIRLHAAGKLPADYHPNLGKGFDSRICDFLRVPYADVVARTKLGGDDLDVLEWCLENGHKPEPAAIEMFNAFLAKRGWRDNTSKTIAERKQQYGIPHREDVQTFFDLIEFDEGRL